MLSEPFLVLHGFAKFALFLGMFKYGLIGSKMFPCLIKVEQCRSM